MKACRYEASCARGPVPNSPGVTDVASCVKTSRFVQQIVPPGATLIGFGMNVKFEMSTAMSPFMHGPGCAVAGEPIRTAAAQIAHTAERAPSAFTVCTTVGPQERIRGGRNVRVGA